jgi:hypothetical protein
MEKSRIVILREFFGIKHGQTLKDFVEEIKALTEADKQELVTAICAQTGDTVKSA